MHLVPVTGRGRLTVLPPIPAELDRIITAMEPYRAPATGDPDDPGLLLPGRPAQYHPLAARYVLTCDELLERAPRDVIEDWLLLLLAVIPSRTPEEERGMAWVNGVAGLCGDLPMALWCEETLHEAQKKFVFCPAGAEVYQLLEPHAARLRRRRAAFQACADAPRDQAPQGPACEAHGYDPGPAAPEQPPHPSMPRREGGPDVLVNMSSPEVDAQLAGLGYTRDTVPSPARPGGARE
jgi:hypothetical protein